MNKTVKIILFVVLVIATIVMGIPMASGFLSTFNPSKAIQMAKEKQAGNLKTYTNTDVGFSFSYDPEIILCENVDCGDSKQISLTVETIGVDKIESPTLGYDKETSIADREELKKGNFGNNADFAVAGEVIEFGGINAKEFFVFSRFDTWDVTFERKIIAYKGNNRIILTLIGPSNILEEENTKYFEKKDGLGLIWKEDVISKDFSSFINELELNKSSNITQQWFNGFDSVKDSFKFTD